MAIWQIVKIKIRKESCNQSANDNGNDSVTSMLSVTVHAAAINKLVQQGVADKIEIVFPQIFERQLNAQFDNAFKGIF